MENSRQPRRRGFCRDSFHRSRIYKAVDPFHWSRLLEELLFPPQYSLPFTLLLSVGEIFGGVMILIPRFRRWAPRSRLSCWWVSWATSESITIN